MRTWAIIMAGCLALSGCAKVRHLDQLLTLKDLAEEQGRMNRYVERQDQNFDRMVEEAKAGKLDQYADKQGFSKAYGEPVFAKNIVENGRELECWLYRHATEYFGGEKIYLYFDESGILVKSEYVEGSDGKSGQETTPENGHQES